MGDNCCCCIQNNYCSQCETSEDCLSKKEGANDFVLFVLFLSSRNIFLRSRPLQYCFLVWIYKNIAFFRVKGIGLRNDREEDKMQVKKEKEKKTNSNAPQTVLKFI